MSPVVTTLFLFGVILGAIAATLGIVYPQLRSLNDQIQLETAGSSMQSLDANIQSLILNGEGSSFFSEVKMGAAGLFNYDNQIFATLEMIQTNNNPVAGLTSTINHSRLQMFQPVSTDFLGEGDLQYFGGAGFQDLYYLNSTSRSLLGWSIIPQQREVGSDLASTSLMYRSIVTSEFDIIPQQLQFNLTVQVQMVNITLALGSDDSRSGAKAGLEVSYLGTTSRLTDWVAGITSDLSFRITIQFPEAGVTNKIERPLSSEKPVDPTSIFSVRYEFVYHQIEVSIF